MLKKSANRIDHRCGKLAGQVGTKALGFDCFGCASARRPLVHHFHPRGKIGPHSEALCSRQIANAFTEDGLMPGKPACIVYASLKCPYNALNVEVICLLTNRVQLVGYSEPVFLKLDGAIPHASLRCAGIEPITHTMLIK